MYKIILKTNIQCLNRRKIFNLIYYIIKLECIVYNLYLLNP